jgi:hypothetical protein
MQGMSPTKQRTTAAFMIYGAGPGMEIDFFFCEGKSLQSDSSPGPSQGRD